MIYNSFSEYLQKNASRINMNEMMRTDFLNITENPEPYAIYSDNKGETSIAGIVNVVYQKKDDGTFIISANIANLFEVGSFSLNFENPMINFTQGNSFFGYSLTFGIDYDKNEFYMSGYVKIPFISPFETDRFVIYSWN